MTWGAVAGAAISVVGGMLLSEDAPDAPDTRAADNAANTSAQISKEQHEAWKSAGFPDLQNEVVKEARTAGSPAEQEIAAGRAGADTALGYKGAQQGLQRQMQGMGVNPGSGAYGANMASIGLARGGATAAAENNARESTKNLGFGKRLDVMNSGRGIPSASAAGLLGASSAMRTSANMNYQAGMTNAQNSAYAIAPLANAAGSAVKSWFDQPSSGGVGDSGGMDISSGGGSTIGWNGGSNANRYGRAKDGGLIRRYAAGGEIQGPGTGTSDSVPAMVDGQEPIAVSDGEHIINNEGTEILSQIAGPEFLDAVNMLGLMRRYKTEKGAPPQSPMGLQPRGMAKGGRVRRSGGVGNSRGVDLRREGGVGESQGVYLARDGGVGESQGVDISRSGGVGESQGVYLTREGGVGDSQGVDISRSGGVGDSRGVYLTREGGVGDSRGVDISRAGGVGESQGVYIIRDGGVGDSRGVDISRSGGVGDSRGVYLTREGGVGDSRGVDISRSGGVGDSRGVDIARPERLPGLVRRIRPDTRPDLRSIEAIEDAPNTWSPELGLYQPTAIADREEYRPTSDSEYPRRFASGGRIQGLTDRYGRPVNSGTQSMPMREIRQPMMREQQVMAPVVSDGRGMSTYRGGLKSLKPMVKDNNGFTVKVRAFDQAPARREPDEIYRSYIEPHMGMQRVTENADVLDVNAPGVEMFADGPSVRSKMKMADALQQRYGRYNKGGLVRRAS